MSKEEAAASFFSFMEYTDENTDFEIRTSELTASNKSWWGMPFAGTAFQKLSGTNSANSSRRGFC